MTDLATTVGTKQHPNTATAQPQPYSAKAPTTLITEQQVLFATAAAAAVVPVPARTRRLGDVLHELAQRVAAVFATSDKSDKHAVRHDYVTRYDFLEDSRMAREMTRL